MSSKVRTYHSQLYREFRAVEVTDFHAVVRFYEAHEDEIRGLDFEEFFEMVVTYTQSLFRVRAYQKHLIMTDVVIEEAIHANIQSHKNEDIYQETLIEKSYSLIYTHQYEAAQHVLRELLKMNPRHVETKQLLKKAKRRIIPIFLQHAKAYSILLFLLSAFVICIELLFVQSWYLQYVPIFEKVWITMLVCGILLLIGGNFYHRQKIDKEVESFAASILKKKAKISMRKEC